MLAGLLMALASMPGAASAQTQTQYPVQESNLQTDKTAVRPGEPITVTGGGFASNSNVTIRFDTAVLGTTVTRDNGTFTTTVTIPANASPGSHTLTAVGTAPNGATRRLTSTIEVLGVAAARGGTLPRTGLASTLPLALGGVGLLGIGTLAVVAARRRRSGSPDSPVAA
ncbi:MAG: hypothetical protein KY454_10785 [Actinobacteria bacterium]|nr:hypothetical protein [Actinomycetota bacterium]